MRQKIGDASSWREHMKGDAHGEKFDIIGDVIFEKNKSSKFLGTQKIEIDWSFEDFDKHVA